MRMLLGIWAVKIVQWGNIERGKHSTEVVNENGTDR